MTQFQEEKRAEEAAAAAAAAEAQQEKKPELKAVTTKFKVRECNPIRMRITGRANHFNDYVLDEQRSSTDSLSRLIWHFKKEKKQETEQQV